MAEITTIKPVERIVEILHPVTKNPVGLRVNMVSLNDDSMSKVKRRIVDERLSNEQRGKRWKAEDIEDNKNRLTFAASTGWEWYDPTPPEDRKPDYKDDPLTFHGKRPEFNFKHFVDVLTELSWVRDQLDEELGDTESFFDHSKSN